MVMRTIVCLVAFLALAGHLNGQAVDTGFDTALSRQKRFSAQNCRTSPETSIDKVPDKGVAIVLSCSTDNPVQMQWLPLNNNNISFSSDMKMEMVDNSLSLGTTQTCIWTHYKPENEGRRTTDPDVTCSSASGSATTPCQTDSRITFQQQLNQCGITISNSREDDTGIWKLVAVGLTSSGAAQTAESSFKVYTYNESKTILTDNRDNPITTLETSYNWNTKKEQWEPGKGDYENVEFRCKAYGGRPIPKFRWYVDNNNNDPIISGDGITVTDASLPDGDSSGYIKNYENRINFRVDDKFLERLRKYSINTNPSNGVFSFELRCEVMQGTYVNPYRQSVRLNVKRTYDDGNLAAGTIGIIVGVVVAVILVVVAIALLVFAKSSGRWCFADDEEAYRKPQEARPRTAAAGGGPAATQQVYSKDQGVTKTEAQPRSGPIRRDSSSASSTDHNTTTKLKNGKTSNGEWMGDTDTSTKPIIKNQNPKASAPNVHQDSGRSSNSPAPSSVSSRSGTGDHAPPPRPYKPPDLQYANIDHSRSFMVDPRNRVLPSSQQQQPYPQPPQQYRQPTGPPAPTAYATIVSNSKIV